MTLPTTRKPTLRRVPRAAGEIAVADYPGGEPAIIIMHGFPDRRTINEPLAQHLTGRRVLLFDFLGYGESDKPVDHTYDAASFEDDLDAVVSTLTQGPVVIVGHDASGPTAINWSRRNPHRTEHLILLNCYYHDTPSLRFPVLIALAADQAARPLTTDIAANEGFLALGFLWQGKAFTNGENTQRTSTTTASVHRGHKQHRVPQIPLLKLMHFIGLSPRKIRIGLKLVRYMAKWKFIPTAEQIGWIEQFTDTPSTTEAFLSWTGDLHKSVASNTTQVESLKSFDRPVTLIFGRYDFYIIPDVATEIAALFPNGTSQLVDAGHWLQLDEPKQVATRVLSALASPPSTVDKAAPLDRGAIDSPAGAGH